MGTRVASLLVAVALTSACGDAAVGESRSALATLSLDALSLVAASDLDPLGPCGFAEGVGPERESWIFFRPDGKRACAQPGQRTCSLTALAGVDPSAVHQRQTALVASVGLRPSSARRESLRIDAVALGAGDARQAANPAIVAAATDGRVSVPMRVGWEVGAYALAVTFTLSYSCGTDEASKTEASSVAVGRVSVAELP